MKVNKVIPENLVAVLYLWEIYFYKSMAQPITALQTPDCDWLRLWFIEVNFSKLTDSNQIFKNDFVCLYYHLCKISTQINKCNIILPMISCNELSITLFTLCRDSRCNARKILKKIIDLAVRIELTLSILAPRPWNLLRNSTMDFHILFMFLNISCLTFTLTLTFPAQGHGFDAVTVAIS